MSLNDPRTRSSDGRRKCDCCGSTRCNKFYKIPVDGKNKSVRVRACGRCVVYNTKTLRGYLDKVERELNES